MSLFSEGGTTYPDVLFVVILAALCLLSTLLNPLVFLYNCSKRSSVPRVLYQVLATFDFLTGLLLPINSIWAIAKREDPRCRTHYSEYYDIEYYTCEAYYAISTRQRVLGTLIYTVIVTPNCILAVLATCRFIQVRFPFTHLKVKHCLMFVGVYLVYVLTVFIVMFSDSLAYYFSLSQTVENVLIVTRDTLNETPFLNVLSTTLLSWGPCFLCQAVSLVTSFLTALHMCQKQEVLGATSERDSTKISLKILVANLGGILYTLLTLVWYFGLSDEPASIPLETQYICFFFYNNVIPVLLSCLNPIVFISLTSNVREDIMGLLAEKNIVGAQSGGRALIKTGTGLPSRQNTVLTQMGTGPPSRQNSVLTQMSDPSIGNGLLSRQNTVLTQMSDPSQSNIQT